MDGDEFYNQCRDNTISLAMLPLLEEKILNFKNKDRYTPFYAACFYGHEDVVKSLLSIPSVDVNSYDDNECTPLFAACWNGHFSIVQLLVNDKRVNINAESKLGYLPIAAACHNGHYNIVEFLLNDSRIELEKGQSILAVACENLQIEIVKLLLSDSRIDLNIVMLTIIKGAPLVIASKNNCEELVELLLGQDGIDVNQRLGDDDTALHAALRLKDSKIAKILLSHPNINATASNKFGIRTAVLAAKYGHHEVITDLLDYDETYVRMFSETPLFAACNHQQVLVVRSLLGHPKVNINHHNFRGETPLHSSCKTGNLELVKEFEEYGIDLQLKDKNGKTPFYYSIVSENLDLIEYFLSKPEINVNEQSITGESPFLKACSMGNINVIQLLMKQGKRIDFDKSDNEGNSPIGILAQKGTRESLILLLESQLCTINPEEIVKLMALSKIEEAIMLLDYGTLLPTCLTEEQKTLLLSTKLRNSQKSARNQ